MIDINKYKKDRTVCKTCYIINKRKKIILLTNNQILKTLTTTKTTTLMFQHLKIMPVLLSGPETLVKLITC